MFELQSTSKPKRRAFLVGVAWKQDESMDATSLLSELGELVDTMGVTVVERLLVKSNRPQSRFLVGSGKAEEIIARARVHKADVIVFDQPITPAQQRNWEEIAKMAVIDREEVILDIFARRARTREARLQVDLARMQYSLPRLTRAWGHLDRQGAGMGAMGVGETQLETDRRLVRKRIERLKAEIDEVRRQRATRRKQRQRRPMPNAAIVGYTNAGKSSLFHKLTGEDVLIEDKLFATLDTTTRKLRLPDGEDVLLTDTVGFVRRLPHGLVESFKATLEESVLADFLIHLLDVSNRSVVEFYNTTMNVLEELGADMKKIITVFNKLDAEKDASWLASLQRHFPEAIFISAQTGEGLENLYRRMSESLESHVVRGDFLLPQSRYDLITTARRNGTVITETYEGDNVKLTAILPPKLASKYEKYRIGKKAVSVQPSAFSLQPLIPKR